MPGRNALTFFSVVVSSLLISIRFLFTPWALEGKAVNGASSKSSGPIFSLPLSPAKASVPPGIAASVIERFVSFLLKGWAVTLPALLGSWSSVASSVRVLLVFDA